MLNTAWGPLDVDDNTVPPVAYLDLRGSYRWTENIQIYAAMDNVFNTPPPVVAATTNSSTPYDASVRDDIYDAIGRQYRVGVRFQFLISFRYLTSLLSSDGEGRPVVSRERCDVDNRLRRKCSAGSRGEEFSRAFVSWTKAVSNQKPPSQEGQMSGFKIKHIRAHFVCSAGILALTAGAALAQSASFSLPR